MCRENRTGRSLSVPLCLSVWLHGYQKWDVRDVAPLLLLPPLTPARLEASSGLGATSTPQLCSTFPSKPNATLSSLLLHNEPAEFELLHTPPRTSRSPCLSKSITAAAPPVSVGSPTV